MIKDKKYNIYANKESKIKGEKMKLLKFLDGSSYLVDEPYCRGCFMNLNADKMPKCIDPVFDNGTVVVRQDAEWPIPAFFIISIKKHIGAFDLLDQKTRRELSDALYFVRKGLREVFGINRAQIYHEEKISSPHFHIWVLPLWEDVMEKYNIQPKIYESNVKKYIDIFNFESNKEKILECNKKMKEYLKEKII